MQDWLLLTIKTPYCCFYREIVELEALEGGDWSNSVRHVNCIEIVVDSQNGIWPVGTGSRL